MQFSANMSKTADVTTNIATLPSANITAHMTTITPEIFTALQYTLPGIMAIISAVILVITAMCIVKASRVTCSRESFKNMCICLVVAIFIGWCIAYAVVIAKNIQVDRFTDISLFAMVIIVICCLITWSAFVAATNAGERHKKEMDSHSIGHF